jgi:hypothetical protein
MEKIGIITVVGQSFIAQYKAVYRNSENLNTITNIHIQAEDMQPIEFDKMVFPILNSENLQWILFRKNQKKSNQRRKNLKLNVQLNNVYVMSDYIF